jgi:DNA-binding transcriptional regulator YdaS (Cro superfamily)
MVLTPTDTGWCNGVMDLKSYLKSLPDDVARDLFAERCGSSAGHLRNVSYGQRPCAPALAVSIERESRRDVTRQELCPDWEKVWPELVRPALDSRYGELSET